MTPFKTSVGRACAALAMLAVAAPPAQACVRPPLEQIVGVDEQIARARDVSVATAVRATVLDDGRVQYDFRVLRRLRGPDLPGFTLYGSTWSLHGRPSASLDHSDDSFWKHGGGRLMNSSDCQLYPNFVVGETYLVFNDEPRAWRGFERIETRAGQPIATDQWLRYVEARLAGREVPPEWAERGRRSGVLELR